MDHYLHRHSLDNTNTLSGCALDCSCLVLQYHRVASLCFDPLQLAVEPYHFEEQIEYLAENFNVISLGEMRRHLETSRPFQERTVVITFDGGYSDVFYTARCVLEKFGIPATVFATSANILEGGRFWWQELEEVLLANQYCGQLRLDIDGQLYRWVLSTYLDRCRAYDDLYSIFSNKPPLEQKRLTKTIVERLELHAEELDYHRTMCARELKQLAQGGLITVGGHTHNCAKLSAMAKSDKIGEIIKNKDILEEVLGHTIEYFSYPFGAEQGYSAEIADILQDVGYMLACGNSYGTADIAEETNMYDVPRVKVGNWNRFAFYRFLQRFFD